MMKALMVVAMSAFVAAQAPPAAVPVPIVGLAQVTFKVSDLGKARAYYDGVLGLAEAFDLKDASGRVTSAYFKINDDQYIEVTPNLRPGDLVRQARIVFQTTDIQALHALYQSRDLQPGPIEKGPDGNLVFRVHGPDDANLDFLQYVPGSQQVNARGKFLDARRLTTHLQHVGIMTKDRAAARPFYQDKIGFDGGRTVPGTRGDYIETPSGDRNTETKNPVLEDTPATHDRWLREQYGAVQHVGLEVPDMRAARDLAQKRGGYDDLRVRAAVGNNRHWLMHLFDPDGSRAEIVETAVQDTLPPMTVMAPGAPAPPILPKVPGQLPWP